MGEDLVLASKWDFGFDVVRFLWVGLFSSLPLWARCTALALFGATLLYGFVTWLRNRSSAAPEPEETAPEGVESVQEDETRVR
ncbi:hypothetical protein ACWFR1_31880 [Streptomyces sp. NPDC055103]